MHRNESAPASQEKKPEPPQFHPSLPNGYLFKIAAEVSWRASFHDALQTAAEQLETFGKGVPWLTMAYLLDAWRAAGEGIAFADWLDAVGGWSPHVEMLHSRGLLPIEFYEQRREARSKFAPDGIITMAELAKHKHLSTRTIQRWIDTGKLPLPTKRNGMNTWQAAELQEVL